MVIRSPASQPAGLCVRCCSQATRAATAATSETKSWATKTQTRVNLGTGVPCRAIHTHAWPRHVHKRSCDAVLLARAEERTGKRVVSCCMQSMHACALFCCRAGEKDDASDSDFELDERPKKKKKAGGGAGGGGGGGSKSRKPVGGGGGGARAARGGAAFAAGGGGLPPLGALGFEAAGAGGEGGEDDDDDEGEGGGGGGKRARGKRPPGEGGGAGGRAGFSMRSSRYTGATLPSWRVRRPVCQHAALSLGSPCVCCRLTARLERGVGQWQPRHACRAVTPVCASSHSRPAVTPLHPQACTAPPAGGGARSSLTAAPSIRCVEGPALMAD
jgi:hypothetical protein